jgi:hypothetical protein
MKYVINESQVDNLIRVYSNFINSKKREGVCDILVDYDYIMDKFILNIFFDREFIINLGDGSKQTSFIRKTYNEIGQTFLSFIGLTPLLYEHYSEC